MLTYCKLLKEFAQTVVSTNLLLLPHTNCENQLQFNLYLINNNVFTQPKVKNSKIFHKQSFKDKATRKKNPIQEAGGSTFLKSLLNKMSNN